jgi:hypothetical protein
MASATLALLQFFLIKNMQFSSDLSAKLISNNRAAHVELDKRLAREADEQHRRALELSCINGGRTIAQCGLNQLSTPHRMFW